MGDFERKADGRRVFTADFKRSTVARVGSGETTVAAISGELGILKLTSMRRSPDLGRSLLAQESRDETPGGA